MGVQRMGLVNMTKRVFGFILVINLIFFITGCFTSSSNNYTLLYKGNFDDAKFSSNHLNISWIKNISVKNKPYYSEEQLWYRNLKTKEQRLLIRFRQYEKGSSEFIGMYAWYPNNTDVVISNNLPNKPNRNLYLVNVKKAGKKIIKLEKKIDDNLEGFISYTNFNYSNNGGKLAIGYQKATKPGLGKNIILVYDFTKGKIQKIDLPNESIFRGAWSSDNKKLALISQIEDNPYAPQNLIIYNLSSGKFYMATKNDPSQEIKISNVNWSPDNNYIAYNSDASPNPPNNSVWIYNIKNKKSKKLSLPKKIKNSQVVGWQKGSKQLLLANNVGLWSIELANYLSL